jgi:hypothetical protein
MPGGDGTGPAGLGPMTGRAAGYCAGYQVPGYMNPVGGRGYWGWGWGFRGGGRGWRNWYYATGLPGWARASQGVPAWGSFVAPYAGYPSGYGGVAAVPTAEQQQDALKQQAQYLQDYLDNVNKRIQELEEEKSQ